MAKLPKAPPVVSEINVTPMVDVMLVLLIIFMVVTPMLQKGASVDMAKTDNPVAMQDADKEDAVLVAITRDGSIFLGSTKVAPDQITNMAWNPPSNERERLGHELLAQYGIRVGEITHCYVCHR